MYLVWLCAALLVMKWLEIVPVQGLSWWWILAPLAVALVWFEFLERMVARDRARAEVANYESGAQGRVGRILRVQGRR